MVQPGWWMRLFFPGTMWRGDKKEKVVYLTFDDGPIPEVTPWVVALLNEKRIKATFFCVGENVAKHPKVYQMLVDNGHSIGNHTYNHISAWKVSGRFYKENVAKARDVIITSLFRPPHGKIYPWQLPMLKKQFSKIVMWDVLTKDYDKRLSTEDVLNNLYRHTRNGSVIVFHDSLKAWPRLEKALPVAIDWLKEQGYEFRTIEKSR